MWKLWRKPEVIEFSLNKPCWIQWIEANKVIWLIGIFIIRSTYMRKDSFPETVVEWVLFIIAASAALAFPANRLFAINETALLSQGLLWFMWSSQIAWYPHFNLPLFLPCTHCTQNTTNVIEFNQKYETFLETLNFKFNKLRNVWKRDSTSVTPFTLLSFTCPCPPTLTSVTSVLTQATNTCIWSHQPMNKMSAQPNTCQVELHV